MTNDELAKAIIAALWSESYAEREKAEQYVLELVKRLKEWKGEPREGEK